jgi:hypothetical protein
MSSSRSIAAARNRRSGDTVQTQMQSRPNKSIASQSAFVNGAQQSQNVKRPGNMQQQQYHNPSEQMNAPAGPVAKLSVSDAIGLVTLRLGRLETFMYDVQAGAIGTTTLPDNTELVDKSVMSGVVQRIESLEKRETVSHTQNSSANLNVLQQQLTRCEKDIKELKEILLNHILKYEKFLIENEKKHNEFNTALSELEQNLNVNDYEYDLQSQNLVLDGSVYNEISNLNELNEGNEGNDGAISSINIKLAIEKELSSTPL